MDYYVYDTEGDGLLDEITKFHCLVCENITKSKWTIFVDRSRWDKEGTANQLKTDIEFDLKDFSELPTFLKLKDKALICHNQFGYDIPVMEKLNYVKDWSVGPDHIDGVPTRLFDTLVMSRGLWPDRPLPYNCPTTMYSVAEGKSKPVGPHGLQSWAFRVANQKPKVDDWRNQPLHVYVHRCIEDVKINRGTWEYLLREMKDTSNGIDCKPSMVSQHLLEYRLQRQGKVGVAFDVGKAEALVDHADQLMKDIEAYVEPMLPERELPKSKQPNFPAKPYKKDGTLSASGIGYAAKFGIAEEDARKFIEDIQGGKEQPKLKEPMRLANQADIKQYLFEVEGWEPTIFGFKDITKDDKKQRRNDAQIAEKAEEYLMRTVVDSPYRPYLEKMLGVRRGQGKQAFLQAAIKNARALPMSPKFKDDRGELCPSLEHLHGDMAKEIVKWLSLRSRRTTILPLDDKKETGWLKDSRVVSEGRLEAGYAGFTNTFRLKHRGVRNVPKAEEGVLLGKEMRDLFYAPEGKLFLTLDTSNMENMIAAWLAKPFDGGAYYNLISTGDPHTNNAKAYTQVAGREVSRGEGKGVTYAVLFGAQKAKIAKMLGITLDKAQKVIDAFWNTNSGLKDLKKYLEGYWEKTGKEYIKGIDGRRIYTRSKHSLLNALIQSTGGILMNLAYIKVYDKLRDEGILHLSPPVIYYHDELSFEVDKGLIEEYKFESEEEARVFSAEGKVLSEPTNWSDEWVRYYSRTGELMKQSVEEASLELGSPFKLTGEYACGPSWAYTH